MAVPRDAGSAAGVSRGALKGIGTEKAGIIRKVLDNAR